MIVDARIFYRMERNASVFRYIKNIVISTRFAVKAIRKEGA